MKLALTICLGLIGFGFPLYLLYWRVFRPILITRLRYRLFATRDNLRDLVLSGEIGEREKAYPIVERFCNHTIRALNTLDFAELMLQKPDPSSALRTDQELQAIFDAGPEVRTLFIQIHQAAIGAIAVNSPGLLVLAGPAALAYYWFNRAKAVARRIDRRIWMLIQANGRLAARI